MFILITYALNTCTCTHHTNAQSNIPERQQDNTITPFCSFSNYILVLTKFDFSK